MGLDEGLSHAAGVHGGPAGRDANPVEAVPKRIRDAIVGKEVRKAVPQPGQHRIPEDLGLLGDFFAHEVGISVLLCLLHGPGGQLPGWRSFASVCVQNPGAVWGQMENAALLQQGICTGKGEDGRNIRSQEKAGFVLCRN